MDIFAAAGEAPATSLAGQDVGGSFPCDDMDDMVNPPGADRFPPVAAVVEAAGVGPPFDIKGKGVAFIAAGRARNGEPYASDEAAVKDAEDGVLLYIAIVRQGDPDLVVTEDEAKAYLQAHPPGPCEAGGPVVMPWVTEDELVRGIQIGETTNNFIQRLMNRALESLHSGVGGGQTVEDLIAQARPTVKITEVGFAAGGGLGCTQGGANVACPADAISAEASATPTATP